MDEINKSLMNREENRSNLYYFSELLKKRASYIKQSQNNDL